MNTFEPAFACPFDHAVDQYASRITRSPHQTKLRFRTEDITAGDVRGLGGRCDGDGFLEIEKVYCLADDTFCRFWTD